MTAGAILIIEDDPDDQEIVTEVFKDIVVSNELKFFTTATAALDYLVDSDSQPFLIISDVNLPGMSGIELREKMNENEMLRKKSIPFVFLTTSQRRTTVVQAYEMMVQGFFVKPHSISELKNLLKLIVNYWEVCRHPNE
jgi:CheY-like chemotaxis protein